MRKIHIFDNDVKVYDYHLLEVQRKRYEHCNIHEEDEEYIFLNAIYNLPQHALYVNVGTAIGYYPILAKKRRRDLNIHCFEPLPRHVQYFKDNIVLNKLDINDFSIHQLAISDSKGLVAFKDSSYGSAVLLNPKPQSIRQKINNYLRRGNAQNRIFKVKAITLRDCLPLLGAPVIDFLQMDIQGLEKAVLAKYFSEININKSPIKAFLIGTHGDNIHNACLNLLHDNGFIVDVDEPETEHQPDGVILAHHD